MNYIGSKKSLLKYLYLNILKIVWGRGFIFSDLFAGTGIVGRFFKQKWHKVIANDLQYYSYVLNKNYIWNRKELYFSGLLDEIPELITTDFTERKWLICEYLNNIPWKKGYIYKNYSLGGTAGTEFDRQYFSDENALKCDGIRQKIEKWNKEKKINENEYHFLLATLLEAIDKVANTASVYGAFLKKLKKSALKPLKLVPADYFLNDQEHDVFNQDINNLVMTTTHDVVYLDPPYNHRQYSWNYHILETIARYDNPKIKGKTGMRDCGSQKSLYCSRNEVKNAYKDLISKIDAKYIFLSYNDEGLMGLDDIKEIMSSRWDYWVLKREYKRFRADTAENRNHKKDSVTEYLHYVIIK